MENNTVDIHSFLEQFPKRPFQVMHIKNLNLIPSLNCQPQIAQLLKLTDCEDNTNV